jgi:hypothetical protein
MINKGSRKMFGVICRHKAQRSLREKAFDATLFG